jgi:hypothetical protein
MKSDDYDYEDDYPDPEFDFGHTSELRTGDLVEYSTSSTDRIS